MGTGATVGRGHAAATRSAVQAPRVYDRTVITVVADSNNATPSEIVTKTRAPRCRGERAATGEQLELDAQPIV